MPAKENEKIKVLHIITRLIIGGAQENTLSTVSGLQKTHHYDITLISGPTYGPEGNLLKAIKKQTRFLILKQLCRPINPVYDIIAIIRLYIFIRKEKFDIVHTHSSKAGILGRLAAHWAKTPVIVHTIHGLPFFKEQNWILNQLFIKLEKWAADYTDKIICVSQSLIDDAIAANIAPGAKFIKIYSGINLQNFYRDAEKKAQIKQELSIPADAPVIVKLARLFHYKGHEYILKAAKEIKKNFPNCRILFIGNGILKKKLIKDVSRMDLTNNVIFAGLVPPEKIPDYLRAADVLVHASLREGLPRAVVQGFAMGLPAVCFNIDGAKDIIIDGVNGYLIKPKDSHSLVQALIDLLKDKSKADKFGNNGKNLVEENFSIKKMVSSIDILYKDLIKKCGK